MRDRFVKGVLVMALCLPGAAMAQQPAATPMAGPQLDGSWELSAGVGGTYLDHQIQLLVASLGGSSPGRIAPGGFVSVGYNLSDMWNLSAGTGIGVVSSVTVIQPFAGVTWTPNLSASTSPFVTVGGGATSISWKGYRATGYGGYVGVGLRHMLSDALALRVEAREQYDKFSAQAFSNAAFEGIGRVGLSWFVGGRSAAVARVAVGPAGVKLASLGATQQLAASTLDRRGRPLSGRAVTWTSSDAGVAAVSSTGVVTARSNGSASISAASEGVSGAVTVAVAQAATTVASAPGSVTLSSLGQTQQFTATAQDASHNPIPNVNVMWSTSDPTVATVDASGVATAVKNGTARITAVTADGPVATATVTVAQTMAMIGVTPPAATISSMGGMTQFTAQAMDANGNVVPGGTFTWSSDAMGVATVGPTGLATAVGNGTTHITASFAGRIGAARLTVTAVGGAAQLRGEATVASLAPGASVVLRNVLFRANSARLTPAIRTALKAVAAAMRGIPDSRWEVGGFTSSMGNAARNLRLSRQRAMAVGAYLVSQGVPVKSLTFVGHGSAHPIATNRTVAGRRLNMRVEIKRLQ